jgi:hypothetical protein
MLLSEWRPDPSDPGEVLASVTLAQDNGVRVGSVIRTQLASAAQLNGARPIRPRSCVRRCAWWASSPLKASSRPGRRCTTNPYGEKGRSQRDRRIQGGRF